MALFTRFVASYWCNQSDTLINASRGTAWLTKFYQLAWHKLEERFQTLKWSGYILRDIIRHDIIKIHVREFFDSDLREVNCHFVTQDTINSSGFKVQQTHRMKLGVKDSIQNGFLFFIPHFWSEYSDLIYSIRPQSPRFVDDCHGTSLFWCALSCPRDWTLHDWSRMWLSLI